jgi:hypothetical protein
LSQNDTVKKAAAKKTSSKHKTSSPITVRGERVPAFGHEFVLIRTARFKTAAKSAKPSEVAGYLVRRVGEALKTPGISDKGARKKKSSLYSVDPADPSRIIRKSADGKTSTGRLVGGKFRVSR